MKPLIDADVLRYEIGSIGEADGEVKAFDFVSAVLDGRINDICRAVRATEEPTLFLTGEGNFREQVAVTTPYKGNRDGDKPFHFRNITAYMFNQYDTVLAEGMEADDLMSIEQTRSGDTTVICTRDKDLRMVPGWHYGWECGKQREYSLRYIEDPGFLDLEQKGKTWKLTGGGMLFFWAQMLMGDSVDTIPGCKGVGPKKAYEILSKAAEPYVAVKDAYKKAGHEASYFIEQGQLLWMVRELDDQGRPVMWQPPS